jgi:DNA-binding response OmpR family regulator
MGDAPAIVIYEEDHQTRTLLKEWLADAGFEVRIGNRCHPGGAEPCGLVIVSVFMPKQGGADGIREIREAHPGTPLLATSGQFRPGLDPAGVTAQQLGVRLVIAKPLIRKELLDRVRGIMEH